MNWYIVRFKDGTSIKTNNVCKSEAVASACWTTGKTKSKVVSVEII